MVIHFRFIMYSQTYPKRSNEVLEDVFCLVTSQEENDCCVLVRDTFKTGSWLVPSNGHQFTNKGGDGQTIARMLNWTLAARRHVRYRIVGAALLKLDPKLVFLCLLQLWLTAHESSEASTSSGCWRVGPLSLSFPPLPFVLDSLPLLSLAFLLLFALFFPPLLSVSVFLLLPFFLLCQGIPRVKVYGWVCQVW